jgi:hypothetical protein
MSVAYRKIDLGNSKSGCIGRHCLRCMHEGGGEYGYSSPKVQGNSRGVGVLSTGMHGETVYLKFLEYEELEERGGSSITFLEATKTAFLVVATTTP